VRRLWSILVVMGSPLKYSPLTILIVGTLVSIGVSSCELLGDTTLPDYGAIGDISYGRHVQVLFDDRCTECHDGLAADLSLVSWTALVVGAESGGVVIPFDPGRSRVMRMLTSRVGGPHPTELGEDTLSVAEVEFLARWIGEGARNDLGEVPYADASAQALVAVADEAIIAVVDLEALAISRIIDLEKLGFSPDSRPGGLVSVADGSGWFVSLPGENSVLRFDSGNVLNGIAEIQSPGALSASANGQWLVVGREAGDTSGRMDVVSTSDMRVRSVESVFPETAASATRPHGDYGFSASRSADQIVSFSLEQGGPSYVALSGPRHAVQQLIVNDVGDRLIAVGSESGAALILDITSPAFISSLGSISLGTSILSAALVGGKLLAIDGGGRLTSTEPVSGAVPRVLLQMENVTGLAGIGSRIVVIGDQVERSLEFFGVSQTGFIRILDAGSGTTLRIIEIDGRPQSVVTR